MAHSMLSVAFKVQEIGKMIDVFFYEIIIYSCHKCTQENNSERSYLYLLSYGLSL